MKMLHLLQKIDAICQEYDIDYWLEGGTLLGAIRHEGFIPWDDDLDISMPRESFERFMKIAPKALPETTFLQTRWSDADYFNLAVPLKVRDKTSYALDVNESGDEPYQQGLFVDIFVYDRLPKHKWRQKVQKTKAKKLMRLLSSKYSPYPMGHHAKLYALLAKAFSKKGLERRIAKIIARAKSYKSPWLGIGYDSVNMNYAHEDEIYPLRRQTFEGGSFNIAHQAERLLERQFGDYMSLPPESERVMKHCKVLQVDIKEDVIA